MIRPPVSWRLLLAVAAGYAAGSLTSFVLFDSSTTGAVLFLPAGVTLSALVLSDRRAWPWSWPRPGWSSWWSTGPTASGRSRSGASWPTRPSPWSGPPCSAGPPPTWT